MCRAIAHNTKDLASRAQSGRLQPHEFQGGSFTISNLGMFGITGFSAVLNPPQACILAVGGISKKACFRDGKTDVESAIYLTLSCDQRCITEASASKFLDRLKLNLSNPVYLLS